MTILECPEGAEGFPLRWKLARVDVMREGAVGCVEFCGGRGV